MVNNSLQECVTKYFQLPNDVVPDFSAISGDDGIPGCIAALSDFLERYGLCALDFQFHPSLANTLQNSDVQYIVQVVDKFVLVHNGHIICDPAGVNAKTYMELEYLRLPHGTLLHYIVFCPRQIDVVKAVLRSENKPRIKSEININLDSLGDSAIGVEFKGVRGIHLCLSESFDTAYLRSSNNKQNTRYINVLFTEKRTLEKVKALYSTAAHPHLGNDNPIVYGYKFCDVRDEDVSTRTSKFTGTYPLNDRTMIIQGQQYYVLALAFLYITHL